MIRQIRSYGDGGAGAGRGFGGFGYRARRSSGRYKPTHGFPVDIAIGGGADGEGGTSPSPVSDPQSSALVTPPRPASGLLPRPRGRGQCVAICGWPEGRSRRRPKVLDLRWFGRTRAEALPSVIGGGPEGRSSSTGGARCAVTPNPRSSHPLPFMLPDVHSTQEPGAGLQARGRQPAPEMHVCGAW